MANVLPPESLDRVWVMYRARLILATACMLFMGSILAALALIPSYLALHIVPAPPVETTEARDDAQVSDALESSKFLVRELRARIAATTSPSAVLEKVLSHKPSGVKVMRAQFSAEREGRFTILGSGTRDQVNAYKTALTQSGAFGSVSVPVGSLVNAEGVGFSIVIGGPF